MLSMIGRRAGRNMWRQPTIRGAASTTNRKVRFRLRELVQKEIAAEYAISDDNLKILWDYGRMIEISRPGRSAEVFKQLLALRPDRKEVSIELAYALLACGQTIDAARVLATLPPVLRSGDAPRYFLVAAYVAFRRGDRNQARMFAGKLMDATNSPPCR